ncbi:hypothetical protein [Oceanobacillus salinisoli]|uniref:hypothetical protein n=1 Tax=Oceanobacillus salinisoli TaxID=2678611 RepID=UPI0012E12667|nr:hypothetical protein [Oceanobacillus salinisoli]
MVSIHGDGVREGKQEIAKKMLKRGMDIELIIEITELSKEEVKRLKDELKN